MHLKLALALLLLLPFLTTSLQFKSAILPSKTRCFFQVLSSNQKYRFDIYPTATPNFPDSTYDINIQYTEPQTKKWINFYQRKDVLQSEPLNIHKLAPISSTYRFCISNRNPQSLMQYSLTLQTGIELMELHLLPDKSDAENMILEMEWIQQQTNRIREMYNNASGGREQVESLSGLTSTKIIVGVLVFTVSVFLLNGLFYNKVKKALHQRKII